MRLRST